MTTHRITFAAVAVIIITLFAASLLKIQLAQALADASSSAATTSAITAPVGTTTTSATTTSAATPAPAAPVTAPSSLKLVHIIGTKYVDYCTDGTKVTAYPGDPAIDAHFNVPDAPTPKCPAGQKWDHTSGMDKYDTASGDLDVGDYAQQVDGTYITHFAAKTYTDATSTSQWAERTVVMHADPSLIESAPVAQPVITPASTTGTTDTSTQ